MDSCAVSVIVPVCNVQRFLRQCLDSLMSQAMQDLQIICINDGSTDDSLSILREYEQRDDRIEVITKPNAGYGHTMNCGLKAARGEYIGIVESDDVAKTTMFEELYQLAKENNADIVKSNFFPYQTNTFISEDDPIDENLWACEYGKVFNPLEEQNIFLTQPAIWSALYRREFLEEEGITFLETPGASFQDTSFNFKAFASAKRVYLTPKAYLYYRIDNAGSSVKSLSKVFCICDEYKNIWEFARSREEVFEKLKYRIPQIQFGGYIWNLERLTPGLQYSFYQNYIEEFQAFEKEGLLNEEYFDEVVWEKLQGMLANPKGYFEQHYGPVEVERTVLLSFENGVSPKFSKVANALLKEIGNNDELYLYSSCADLNTMKEFAELEEKDPRLHFAEGEISSGITNSVDIDAIQGKELVVVEINGSAFTPKKLSSLMDDVEHALASNVTSVCDAWAVGTWDVSTVKGYGLPIWTALLFGGLYEQGALSVNLPAWLNFEEGEEPWVTLKEFNQSYEEFKCLYAQFVSSVDDPLTRHYNHSFFMPIWKRMENSFNALGFEERLQCEQPPCVNDFDSWLIVNERALAKRADLAVVIPVFNTKAYLKQCLDSVFSQTVESMQVICVDDGSTDGSLEYLIDATAEYEKLTVVSQFNGGAGAARNRALGLINAEYVAFIDPDDTYVDNQVLSKLLSAAKDHNAKLSGGSFMMVLPDGEEVTYFGGRQAFYTIRKEGMQSLSGLQTDYGWIRFMYHHSIFDEGKVRFPDHRHYEDPVFLVRVMKYCDEFYGIKDLIYRYRAEYKEPTWTVAKVRHILQGIEEDSKFAQEKRLNNFYTALILRLNVDFCSAIMEFINDEEVFTRLTSIQGNLDHSLMNDIVDAKSKTYLIKPLLDYAVIPSPLAIVRFAKRFGKSSLYKKMQSVKRRLE